MRTPPTNWTTLMAQPHETETRLDIAGVSYYGYDGNSGIWSCETRPMLFDKLSVGNCCSATINLVLVNPQTIPTMAKMELYVRLVGDYDLQDRQIFYFTAGEQAPPRAWVDYSDEIELVDGAYRLAGDIVTVEFDRSNPNAVNAAAGHYFSIRGIRGDTGLYLAPSDATVKITTVISARKTIWSFPGRSIEPVRTDWVRKGIYYIDTREWDAQHEFLTITGYDAMLKTEQDYFTPPVTITSWPKTDAAVVSEICTRIGVELDTRTVLNKGYMVQLPAVSSDGSDSDTLREVLGWIGAMYGGNWCITDEGKLRLVPLVPTETVSVGTSAIDLSTSPAYDALGIVHLIVSEDAEYVAGTSGRSIEISCPWGTQAMANNILTAIGGYVYQPLTITAATEANPLWEIGDGVTVNGYTSVIAAMPTAFGLKYTADIEAPESEEINHEYPFVSKENRAIERKIAQSSASLKIDIDAIIAQVTDGQGNYTALTLRSDGLHVGNAQGTVTIGSGSIHIPNGAITFGDGTLNGALQAAYNNTGGGDPNPSYIHSTYISQTKVISPHIYGGDLYATGQGNASGTNPAFYMSDGVTGSGGNTQPNAPKGWLCYDKNGAGTTQEAQNRVFLHSVNGVAMKLKAGGNMSLEANDSIYLRSHLKLRSGINYGTAAQRRAITPENGQIFFEIS